MKPCYFLSLYVSRFNDEIKRKLKQAYQANMNNCFSLTFIGSAKEITLKQTCICDTIKEKFKILCFFNIHKGLNTSFLGSFTSFHVNTSWM